MKVLGINGSPRIGGNADLLLDRALDGARSVGAQTEKIILNELKFSPCQGCDNSEGASCALEDDMQEVYKKIEGADALILASPVFFGSLSAQAKMMIDRFQCEWRAKYVLKKRTPKKNKTGAFISTAASDRQDFFNNSKQIVKNLFATVNAVYKEELFCPGVDKKGEIAGRPDFLKEAFELGQRVAQ